MDSGVWQRRGIKVGFSFLTWQMMMKQARRRWALVSSITRCMLGVVLTDFLVDLQREPTSFLSSLAMSKLVRHKKNSLLSKAGTNHTRSTLNLAGST